MSGEMCLKVSNYAARLKDVCQTTASLDFFLENCEFMKSFLTKLRTCRLNQCPFFDKKGYLRYPNNGSAINIYKKWLVTTTGQEEPKIRIMFEILMESHDCKENFNEKFLIDVPCSLIDNFKFEDFEKWYGYQSMIFRAKAKIKARNLITKQFELFPDLKKEFLPLEEQERMLVT